MEGEIYTDPVSGATVFDSGERMMPGGEGEYSPDVDSDGRGDVFGAPLPEEAASAPQPATPAAAPPASAPAQGQGGFLDGAEIVAALERDAGFHAAAARQHLERYRDILQEGQRDVAAVETSYAEGRSTGVRDVGSLATRQIQREVRAQQALAAARQAHQESLNERAWAGEIDLGHIKVPGPPPAAGSTPAPGAETAGESPISVEDARTFGLA